VFAVAIPATAATFTGRVERVIDGDTIVVQASLPSLRCRCAVDSSSTNCASHCSVQLHKVRLAEIDAPEMKTPEGPASQQALSDMILHKTVTVAWTHRGRYRRIIGQVYLGEEWVNLRMVRQGWAVVFQRYAQSVELKIAARETCSR